MNFHRLAITSAIALAIACHAASSQASFITSSLTSLLAGNSLSSSEGALVFEGFQVSGNAQVDTDQFLLTADFNGEESILALTLPASSRVLTGDELIDLSLSFSIRSVDPMLVIRSASLDIRGATLGTSGLGRAGVVMELVDESSSVATLSVADSSTTPPDYFDEIAVSSITQELRVSMELDLYAGGTPGSLAVLSDWRLGFVVGVPEPSSGWLAGMLAAATTIRRRRLCD